VEHCELAVKRLPSELRLQYQLARALQFVDRHKAFEAQKRLVELKYPAAFDNAGWLYITQDRNYAQAAKLFRMGAQLGDPDCMMSLAELIENGYATPSNANETTAALYARAAQLRHPRAQEKFEAERENAIRPQQDRRGQEEGARQMMQIIRPFLRSILTR
jgi:TPR repeat protein